MHVMFTQFIYLSTVSTPTASGAYQWCASRYQVQRAADQPLKHNFAKHAQTAAAVDRAELEMFK